MDKCVKITFYRNNKMRFYVLIWNLVRICCGQEKLLFTFKDKQLVQ